MDIYCRVTPNGLVPLYDSDHDEKQKLREGETVLCRISKPRNYEFHKKFFALVRVTFDNLPERLVQMLGIRSEEDMLDCIKIDLGLFNTIWHGGRQVIRLGSISFAAMDNIEFEKFYNRSVTLVLNKYLCGTSRQSLTEEIARYY
ncbi:MAG: DUF1367 family protein [Bacteroidaceae bacterium]|nr:DUF1367 family protein [Bacteroidaceae bacterium]